MEEKETRTRKVCIWVFWSTTSWKKWMTCVRHIIQFILVHDINVALSHILCACVPVDVTITVTVI